MRFMLVLIIEPFCCLRNAFFPSLCPKPPFNNLDPSDMTLDMALEGSPLTYAKPALFKLLPASLKKLDSLIAPCVEYTYLIPC